MKIIEKDIDALKEYENNPRINDDAVQYVANSIKEFGFKVPVVIDKENVIVAGHTRVKACRRLGIDKVPCIVADDLTDEQVKAYRMVDNKSGEIANWDYEALQKELDALDDFDMTDFGFVDGSIDEYIEPDYMSGRGASALPDKPERTSANKEIECPSCGFKFEA